MDDRCLITPYQVACEFQMLLAEAFQVCPLEGEMRYETLYDLGHPDFIHIKIDSLGWATEISVTMHDLTLSMDEFSDRCVKPSIEYIKHARPRSVD